MKTVAVLQSNYLPWRGYFDIIHDVDLFVFYDEVQYTTRDWRSRNRVYSPQGLSWLTVPCGNDRNRAIDQVMPLGEWQQKHLALLTNAYRHAPYWEMYQGLLRDVYETRRWEYLYQLNRYLIMTISRDYLGIQTQFADSREFASTGVKHEKLLSLLKSTGCTRYVSGPAAKDYIVEADYRDAGIEIVWKDYGGYPEYPQQREPFEPNVSVIDLLMNTGAEASWYVWGWRDS